jgi:RimJ/RimL family protein N-acetyltransferase
MANFAAVETPNGVAGLRDLTPADLPAIIHYWLSSPDEYVAFLGIDRQKLGGADDIRKRFSNSIRTGDPAQLTISLAITLDDRLVGYTLFVRHSDDVNYSHWHLIVPELRAKGLSTALYPHRIKAYFDIAPISRLIHQTRTRNLGVNRMLDKFFPIAETIITDQPDGVALPGEFHIRYVSREDIPKIFARAEELRAASNAQPNHASVEPGS